MMRGQKSAAVAVRAPSGRIVVHQEPLTAAIYRTPLAKIPFLRGLVMLWDMLVLGMRTLLFSAEVALAEEGKEGEVRFSGAMVGGTVLFSLAMAIALFFVAPLALVGLVDRFLASALTSNLLEGLIRLAIFVAYLVLIAQLPDIRRVFAYHGAEHKTVNAYEGGAPLTPEDVSRYTTVHPRCGTTFVLVVLVASIVVFALLGRPPMVWRVASRIFLVPLIATVVYEFIRWMAAHYHRRLIRWLLAPGLLLQSLTTREPDRDMLEVAIVALQHVLVGDGVLTGEQIAPGASPADRPEGRLVTAPV